MSRRTCALVVVTAVAASVPAAHAAPPWSEPRTVSPSGGAPAIDSGAGGALRLSWIEGFAGSPDSVMRFATMLHDGSVVVRGGLTRAPAAQPQYCGRDCVVLPRVRQLGRPSRRTGLGRYRLDALFGATSSTTPGRLRRVATFSVIPGYEVAAMGTDGRGEVAVAWVEFRGRESAPDSYRVRVALGREDRGFGRPQTLASAPFPRVEDSPTVTVAYGAGGDLLVAHTLTRREGRRDQRFVAARVRRRGGAFGRLQVLGPRQAGAQLTAAIAPDGRAVVAWGSQDGGEGVELPFEVRAAVRSAGRTGFRRAQLLDPGEARDRPAGRIALAMSADGRATLAWANARGRTFPLTYPVRTANTGRTGGFTRVAQLAENGGVHDLAVAADGSAVVTWSPYDPEEELPAPLYAQFRPSGAAVFGAAEQVVPSGAWLSGGDVAFDPRAGRPVVIWATGTGLQLSTRTG